MSQGSKHQSDRADGAFAARLLAIHSTAPESDTKEFEVKTAQDSLIRRDELLAMFNVYLGPDYDNTKIEKVVAAQTQLHKTQVSLVAELQRGELSPADYVDRFNANLELIFLACQSILGAEDFQKAFGAPPEEMSGFIDKEVFLSKYGSSNSAVNNPSVESAHIIDQKTKAKVADLIALLSGSAQAKEETQIAPKRNRTEQREPVPAVLLGTYKTLRLDWDESLRALHVRVSVKPIQCYSLSAMAELETVLSTISRNPGSVSHLVMTSDVPRVFHFGGDLALFVLLVRAGDVDSLRLYSRRTVDLLWWFLNAAALGVHTSVLVQGDVLGSGLEAVLPFHKIIFENTARAGFPEVLYNHFPGAGAWALVARKAGARTAREMILSGRIYSAEQLCERGLVDHVVDDGTGDRTLQQTLVDINPRLKGTLAALRCEELSSPISYDALTAASDVWAESALKLADRDLRLMERLARAQAREAGGSEEGAIEEIKRQELELAWGNRRGDAKEPQTSRRAAT